MSCFEKWLRFILRLHGVLAIMAIFAVVMPNAWLDWCVSKVQADLSQSFLVGYLARSLSMFFVLVGVFLVIFASDVARYRVPITCVAAWILSTIVCFGLYTGAYLPQLAKQWFFWFVVADATWSALFALAIVFLQMKMRSNEGGNMRA